ncbi:MAG: helix-turn-helix transcriptional regulator [Planctomycetaceae bacterium]|nr:helix-turn-helix transcriptional regulator [Planctomycetaceae bacterium]
MVEARKACGLTQAMLAQKLSRPQSFVSKYERGERRLDLVEFLEIARAIGIDALEFIKRLDDL